jgi:cobalt-zinc-cadmium efflux system protein
MSKHTHCNHEHGHGHHHDHGDLKGKNLIITIVLNVIITVAQIIAGVISGSLALLSDAMHNFSDVLALVVTKVADNISKKLPNYNQTFGYKRSKIVAALFNSSVLVIIGLYLIYEAIMRFFNPQPVVSDWVIYMAILSIILNFASVVLLKNDAHDDMNIKSAYLHLLSDVMTSIAVLIGGLAMKYLQWYWLDPIITIMIAVYLIYMSYSLVFESIEILMQSTPKNIDIEKLKQDIESFEEVQNAHHMHVWKLDDKDVHVETHVDFKEDVSLSFASKVCAKIEALLKQNHKISHLTIQPEFGSCEQKDLIKKHK